MEHVHLIHVEKESVEGYLVLWVFWVISRHNLKKFREEMLCVLQALTTSLNVCEEIFVSSWFFGWSNATGWSSVERQTHCNLQAYNYFLEC